MDILKSKLIFPLSSFLNKFQEGWKSRDHLLQSLILPVPNKGISLWDFWWESHVSLRWFHRILESTLSRLPSPRCDGANSDLGPQGTPAFWNAWLILPRLSWRKWSEIIPSHTPLKMYTLHSSCRSNIFTLPGGLYIFRCWWTISYHENRSGFKHSQSCGASFCAL